MMDFLVKYLNHRLEEVVTVVVARDADHAEQIVRAHEDVSWWAFLAAHHVNVKAVER